MTPQIGSTVPCVRGAGPMPDIRSVARLPRTGGTLIPPRTARYVRRPPSGISRYRLSPSCRANGAYIGAGRLPVSLWISAGAGAPARASVSSPCAFTERPPRTVSMTASPGSLPTRRLAWRVLETSAAPETETPRSLSPGRPRSWIRLWGPGESTSRDGEAAAVGRAPSSFSVELSATSMISRTATYCTVVPGRRRAGSSRSRSHMRAGVRPMSCQPPGERRG